MIWGEADATVVVAHICSSQVLIHGVTGKVKYYIAELFRLADSFGGN